MKRLLLLAPAADMAGPCAIAGLVVLFLCILAFGFAMVGWVRSSLVMLTLAVAVFAVTLLAVVWSHR